MKINRNLIIVMVLFAVVLINYVNVFPNEFVWDDKFFIEDNIHIKSLKNIPEFFVQESPGNLYRPLRTTFYTLNYRIWQLNPVGYHLNSLILHFLVTTLIFFITLKITNKTAFSFVVALLFAAHPIHTARITNMTAAFDVFGILFFLISFFLYILFSKTNIKKYYYLSIVSFLLAIFSSEEAITFILILFLYDFSFNHKINFNNTRLLLKKYIPFITITIFYLIIRFLILGQVGRQQAYFEQSFFGTMLTTAKIFLNYILILFYPVSLTIERVVKFETSLLSLSFLISFLILLLILFFFIKSYNKSKLIFFSVGWFFITLLPFSNLFPQVTIMADRYLYLPSFGFTLFLTFLIFKIKDINPLKKHSRYIILILIVLLTLSFSYLTIQRNAEWKDNFTLLSTEAEKNPLGTRIHHALALHYRNEGDYDNAIKFASRAIVLSSKNYHAYENLGTINAYLKNYDKAIAFYEKSLELSPDYYLANNNLGLIYSYINDPNSSVFYLKKAIELNPGLSKAHNDIGTVYAQLGEFDLAIEEMEKSIEINPYEADYYYNLAVIYEFLDEKDKASNLLKQGLEVESENEKIKIKLNDLN